MSVASPGLEFAGSDPRTAEAADFAIAGNFDRIAGDAVDPGVADFLSDGGQVVAKGLDRVGDFGKTGGSDLGVRELAAQGGVNIRDLGRRVRAAIVVAHDDGDGQVGAGHMYDAAVAVVVHHHERSASRVFPDEERRKFGGSAGIVDADVEKLYALRGERRDDAAGVAGNVGHLGAGGGAAEAAVERVRESDAGGDHGGVHHLGLPAEGDGVPGDVALGDGLFHAAAVRGRGLLEILVEEP